MNPQSTLSKSLLHFAYWPSQVSSDTRPGDERKRRIVIAEDDPLLCRLYSFKLTVLGYTVRCAKDGEAGWQSLHSEPFDLLITDYEMPNLNGLDLIRRMRKFPFKQPVIMISGNVPEITPELRDLLLPGAALAKPFSFTDLIPTMEALLLPVNHLAISDRRSRLAPVESEIAK